MKTFLELISAGLMALTAGLVLLLVLAEMPVLPLLGATLVLALAATVAANVMGFKAHNQGGL